ncbi:hypothetical protein [Rhodococcus sp. SGAir0479]|uniref:hypothetical protein n=1 Tax=Rhodococcus sp. SGAir0479 TaxID=2567884 RepID=UPI0010CD3FA7|nr:hypothetical protein [Rhodococcus sp. SGAir0479]QCQ93441.1 hypothetical protein E7742_20945 [Rhodococcus sp. SGAir0479]
MGIVRLSLDLPSDLSDTAAVEAAAAHLAEQRVRDWTDLSLQTRLTHDDPHARTYTFTYWRESDPS